MSLPNTNASVAYQGGEIEVNNNELLEQDNYIENHHDNQQLTIAQKPSFITPSYPKQKTVVNHNQLQHIQRNIFLQQPKDYAPWSSSSNNYYNPNSSSFDNSAQ